MSYEPNRLADTHLSDAYEKLFPIKKKQKAKVGRDKKDQKTEQVNKICKRKVG
jgi:hypothetical protein